MSKLERKALEEKERQLRKELNQVSDEFESQLIKVAGFALVGGLVSYGIHKLLSPKRKSRPKKSNIKNANQTELSEHTQHAKSSSSGAFSRIAGALLPIIVSSVGSEIMKNFNED